MVGFGDKVTIHKKPYKVPSFDMLGKQGMFLRGRKVYGQGGTSPNPSGRNQWASAAKTYMKRRGAK